MRTPKGSRENPTIDLEAVQFDHLRTLVTLQRWPEARTAAHELAHKHPHNSRYRALLALARGHEAATAGDTKLAHEEWGRALALDPTLEAAATAMRRHRRPSLIARLFRRS